MSIDLTEAAKERGIKFFLVSYTDLFGAQRAKLVPAAAIGEMVKEGAGFAGFATWLRPVTRRHRPARHARSGQHDPTALEA